MFDLLAPFVANPVLPATLLVGCMTVWSVIVIVLGAADFGFHHLGHDGHGLGGLLHHHGADVSSAAHGSPTLPSSSSLHVHPDLPSPTDIAAPHPGIFGQLLSTLGGFGIQAIRWLNLSEMPLVLWAVVFALLWWAVSLFNWMAFDSWFFKNPNWFFTSILVVRNLTFTIPMVKLCTIPMRGWFGSTHLESRSLIGHECEISSSVATPEFGQVKFKTDGSPLLLNVRTDGPHLPKGSKVWITHYDPKRRVYLVSPTSNEYES